MLLKLLIGLIFVNQAFAWKIFHLGRIVGGNLGKPSYHKDKYDNASISEEYFIQNLDHFNPTDQRTWKQRYFTNNNYFDSNNKGPVFLMIGGEGEASNLWMTQGAWIDYAKKFNALCFQLEHRFYGKSHPTEDISTKNLQYLTSQQALADLANFINGMKNKYNLSEDIKWIAFGGSYPGSLAAWLRMKYPHLIHGSMSASGPLLAQLDFKDYFRVVDESLATHSDECVDAVKEGTEQINKLLLHMVGQRSINEKFKLCDPIEKSIENPKDVSNFFETLSGNFAGIVQYNKDNRIGKSAKPANITIDTLCDIMVNEKNGAPVDRLAAINQMLLSVYDQKCLDYKYDNMIETLRNTSWESTMAEGGRQWTYQTCTEFGFYQTSTYQPQVFGDQFPIDFFVQQCTDIFGPKFNEQFLNNAIERTNYIYGALNIDVTNVVFVHGSIDPWHALGITKTMEQDAPAIYIKGTAHCANMYPKSENDLPQLSAAREQIQDLIDKWLRL